MSDNFALGSLILAIIGLLVACVGLFLAFSTTGHKIFWTFAYWVIGARSSYYGRGDRLTWHDLAATGTLHTCHFPNKFPYCQSHIHVPEKQCWSGLLSDQFSRTWEQRKLLTIRKPIDVRLRASFIKTDTRVLFAFMLLSAPDSGFICWDISTENTQNGEEYHFNLGSLELRLWRGSPDGPFLGHLEALSRGCKRLLTRHECEKMLSEGCQPWYRSTVPFGTSMLSFPDWSIDRDRGGWIALVGLGKIAPTPLYMRDIHGSGTTRQDYQSSCGYVLKIVRDYIKPRVADHTIVDVAILALQHMYQESSSSGLDGRVGTDLHQVTADGMYTSHLSYAQGSEIVKLFSSRDNFTNAQIPEALVKPAVAAAVRGVWKVYKYLQNESYGLGTDVRHFLDGQRTVYLVDCSQFGVDNEKKEN